MWQVYLIKWPNGKIYVGLDRTSSPLYFGSASDVARITADLGDDRFDFMLRKTILLESDSISEWEARAIEMQLIRRTRANDPAIGYNLSPRFDAERLGLPKGPPGSRVTARGRSGRPSVRNGWFPNGTGWAVDVRVPDSSDAGLRAGQICWFFVDLIDTKPLVDKVNRGEHQVRGMRSCDPTIVPARNVQS